MICVYVSHFSISFSELIADHILHVSTFFITVRHLSCYCIIGAMKSSSPPQRDLNKQGRIMSSQCVTIRLGITSTVEGLLCVPQRIETLGEFHEAASLGVSWFGRCTARQQEMIYAEYVATRKSGLTPSLQDYLDAMLDDGKEDCLAGLADVDQTGWLQRRAYSSIPWNDDDDDDSTLDDEENTVIEPPVVSPPMVVGDAKPMATQRPAHPPHVRPG